jgi:hypothetical protein
LLVAGSTLSSDPDTRARHSRVWVMKTLKPV